MRVSPGGLGTSGRGHSITRLTYVEQSERVQFDLVGIILRRTYATTELSACNLKKIRLRRRFRGPSVRTTLHNRFSE